MDLGWIGILMIAFSVLYLLSLLSYDPVDPPLNSGDTANGYQNMIGPVGAYLSYISFLGIGFAAYMMPLLLLMFGLAFLHPFFAYLRNSWKEPVAALIYTLALMGLLQELDTNFGLDFWAKGFQLGGVIAEGLIYPVFHTFGTAGAIIIYSAFLLASLYYLTNIQPLEIWARLVDLWEDWRDRRANASFAAGATSAPSEKNLKRKAKRLDKALDKQKKAIDELEAAQGLGADLKPVPEPTIRDLSVAEPKPAEPESPKDPGEVEMGEVISAEEVKASSDPEEGEAKESEDERKDSAAEAADRPTEHEAASTAEVLGQAEDSSSDSETKGNEDSDQEPAPKPKPAKRLAKPKGPMAVAKTPNVKGYKLPKSQLLDEPEGPSAPAEPREQLLANARLLKETLQQFRIEVTEGDITKGPTITRYELHPAPGVKLERITGLANNIAAAIKAERINILAPVPGRSSVGIEVPNRIKTKVLFRDIVESPEWKKSKAKIPLALGKDVYGKPIVADLAEMPHMLIAGATGSGKSVCINSIISSILFKFGPDELRFIMIDPKVVEMQVYADLPHLVVPVVTDPRKVVGALKWCVNEMERRYKVFAKEGVRNFDSFNSRARDAGVPAMVEEEEEIEEEEVIDEEHIESIAAALEDGELGPVDGEWSEDEEEETPDRFPYIGIIIDELADLMQTAPADVEMCIARIAQKARAAGIHLIVATQTPRADVVTGIIKANIPSRIAFQVSSALDSRVILDNKGAEKLVGKGDMLFLPPGSAKLDRAQGAWISDEEVESLVDFCSVQSEQRFEESVQASIDGGGAGDDGDEDEVSDADEEILQKCIEVIMNEQKASTSLLQRRLRLGYTRAARMVDILEQRGVVGPADGSRAREVFLKGEPAGVD